MRERDLTANETLATAAVIVALLVGLYFVPTSWWDLIDGGAPTPSPATEARE